MLIINSLYFQTSVKNPIPNISTGDENSGSYIRYSTYFGGTDWDSVISLAIDSTDACIIAGMTSSIDFPTLNAFDMTYYNPSSPPWNYYDGFVSKFNEDGILNFSTYLGGSSFDDISDITVDSDDNYYITGSTASTDFPLLNAWDSINNATDIFLTKFDSYGNLTFSTFFGGSSTDWASSIEIDGDGAIYLAGETFSTDFPLQNAYQNVHRGISDLFITKLTLDGSLQFSTFFGGSGYEEVADIAIDESGAVFVVGYTADDEFPTTTGAIFSAPQGLEDIFVTKFNSDGNLCFSTYLGGSDNDNPYAVAVDKKGSCYICGITWSEDYPIYNCKCRNKRAEIFVTKLNPNGNILYSTVLGGNGVDTPLGIFIDSMEACYITGYTAASDFPTLAYYDNTFENVEPPYSTFDAFILKLNPDSSLNYSTYLGGDGMDGAVSVVITDSEEPIVTGVTESSNFPNYNAFDPILNIGSSSNRDVFVTKLFAPYGDPDNDGIPTYWEYQMNLNSTDPSDASMDIDGDTLSNLEEFQRGSNPYSVDTDKDGLRDNKDPWPASFMAPTGWIIVIIGSIGIGIGIYILIRPKFRRIANK